MNAIAANINSQSMNFGIQTGDFVDNGGNLVQWNEILDVFSRNYADIPVVQVMGNHEYYGDLFGIFPCDFKQVFKIGNHVDHHREFKKSARKFACGFQVLYVCAVSVCKITFGKHAVFRYFKDGVAVRQSQRVQNACDKRLVSRIVNELLFLLKKLHNKKDMPKRRRCQENILPINS